jgi:hypothetical protein
MRLRADAQVGGGQRALDGANEFRMRDGTPALRVTRRGDSSNFVEFDMRGTAVQTRFGLRRWMSCGWGSRLAIIDDVFLSGMKKGRTRSMRIRPLLIWVGSDLQALDRPESGSDRLHFTGTGLLVAVDGFEFHGQITQQVESIVELVTNEQSHVDGFFRWCFLVVGCW